MNFSRLLLTCVMLCGIATGAKATRNPVPPSSGIVVHLFGPNSITSNMVPDLPSETAKPANPPPAAGPGGTQPQNGQQASGQGNAATSATAPQPAYTEPTVSEVLHQMFVVGDPNHPTTPSAGRSADRPPTGK